MRLQIEPTDEIVEVRPGLQARAWKGVSEKGMPCIVFVAMVGVPEVPGWEEFQQELNELPYPGQNADVYMATKIFGDLP